MNASANLMILDASTYPLTLEVLLHTASPACGVCSDGATTAASAGSQQCQRYCNFCHHCLCDAASMAALLDAKTLNPVSAHHHTRSLQVLLPHMLTANTQTASAAASTLFHTPHALTACPPAPCAHCTLQTAGAAASTLVIVSSQVWHVFQPYS